MVSIGCEVNNPQIAGLSVVEFIDAAPPGSTITLQLDDAGAIVAWYVRQPDAGKRSLYGSGR